MELLLNRKINFRVAMLDYFLTNKQIFKNPITIEIQFFEQLKFQATYDELTQAYNRRFIHTFYKKS